MSLYPKLCHVFELAQATASEFDPKIDFTGRFFILIVNYANAEESRVHMQMTRAAELLESSSANGLNFDRSMARGLLN